jgi:hypothetical protein
VSHDADGSKSISVSLSTAIHTGTVSTVSSSWQLDSIPRAATLLEATNFNDDGNPAITYSNPAGDAVYALHAFIYAADDTTILVDKKELTKTGKSYTFSLSNAERKSLREAAANSNRMTVKFYIGVKFKSSDAQYTWSEPIDKTFSIVNAAPEATITRCYDSNETANSLTGGNDKFVKHKSHLNYTIEVKVKKGATIPENSCWVSLGSKTSVPDLVLTEEDPNGAYAIYTGEGKIENIDGGGFSYSVIDSRGNNNGFPIKNFTGYVPYVPLTINPNISTEITGETGATVTVAFSGQYFPGDFGEVANQLTLWYRYKEKDRNYNTWQKITDGITIADNAYSKEIRITGLSYEKTYVVECRASDKFGDVYATPYTIVLKPVFDWGENGFNFNVPVSVNGIEQPYIVEQGTAWIWTYRKWADGTAECWTILENASVEISTPWGVLYESTGFWEQLPPGLFVETPRFDITMVGSRAVMLCVYSAGTATETPRVTAVRPDAKTIEKLNISIVCHGRWK